MNVREYLRSTKNDPEDRERVVARAGTSMAYLRQLAGGHSRASAEMCIRLEDASDGRITREDLRPDLFVRQDSAA